MKPIGFKDENVLAIINGRKTQTRRIITGPWEIGEDDNGTPWPIYPGYVSDGDYEGELVVCSYGSRGEKLWVKEMWGLADSAGRLVDPTLNYRSDGSQLPLLKSESGWKHAYSDFAATDSKLLAVRSGWRSWMFMPRWASRITLEITEVRVQKLQNIDEEDAKAEGIIPPDNFGLQNIPCLHCGQMKSEHLGEVCHDLAHAYNAWTFRDGYRLLWNSINGKKCHWGRNPWVWCITFKRVQPA